MTSLFISIILFFNPVAGAPQFPESPIKLEITQQGAINFIGLEDHQEIFLKMRKQGGEFKFQGMGKTKAMEKTISKMNKELSPGIYKFKVQMEGTKYHFEVIRLPNEWLIKPH